jgi:predicted RNase H-like HicB family nuclease
MFVYEVTLSPGADPGDIEARLPDVPEALAFGATAQEALEEAALALDAAFDHYWTVGKAWPAPRALPASALRVALSVPRAARLALKREMEARDLKGVALAALAGVDEKVVRRVLSGQGARVDQTLRLLDALGARPALAMV